ncbi:MAG: DJ-1/PfpI family protein [Rhodospirillales bacterium]|nr:DJ-1/PfpI family protein [Rhodospirillales bacterium]
MVPFQALQMVGTPRMPSAPASAPARRSGRRYDFEGTRLGSEKPGHNFPLNASFDEVDEATYDALLILGWPAPEYLRVEWARAGARPRHFRLRGQADRRAVCHGAQLLAAAGVIKGRRISAYPACAPEVELAGGQYCDIPVDDAVTDANIVTAPAWPAHLKWLAQFLGVLANVRSRAA